jgi:VanZ family protein
MMGCRSRVSCRNFFRQLGILPLVSQYIFSLMLLVVSNKDFFIINSEKHNLSTRQSNNFHQLIANFTVYQKGLYCMGITVFNNFPPHIKDISHNPRKFEICLKYFLHTHYFYSIDEYFQYKAISNQYT